MTKEELKNRVATFKEINNYSKCDWVDINESESFLMEIYNEAYKLGYDNGYDTGYDDGADSEEQHYDPEVKFGKVVDYDCE